MTLASWYIVVGALLVLLALSATYLKRLPLTTSIIYLVVGVVLGPWVMGAIRLDMVDASDALELMTELAVIVSLFSAGLKLTTRIEKSYWVLPIALASGSMIVTVALIATVGVFLFDLPLGAAVVLGAVLAPTDPVLASDVQVEKGNDRDRLRFGLTAEAGLNDGAAFPFVMLGLWLLGLHEPTASIWRWVGVDLVWAVTGGLAIGAVTGYVVGRLVVILRRNRRDVVGLEDFLALGLLALSYGLALSALSYGFLAVFVAGLMFRRVEAADRREHADDPPGDATDASADAAPYHAGAVVRDAERLERILELLIVVFVGAMLSQDYVSGKAFWLAPLLLLVIRPLATLPAAAIFGASRRQRWMIGWFGIRGIGSIYYLAYAINHGMADAEAHMLASVTLATIAVSIAAHGISVTPLMRWYEGKK